jgi:hypothetical protein
MGGGLLLIFFVVVDEGIANFGEWVMTAQIDFCRAQPTLCHCRHSALARVPQMQSQQASYKDTSESPGCFCPMPMLLGT